MGEEWWLMTGASGDYALKLFLSLPDGLPFREVQDEWDYGPDDSRLLRVRRTWAAFTKCNPQTSFGYYLGRHHNKYVVGVRDIMEDELVFTSSELFDTLDECKEEWMVDVL